MTHFIDETTGSDDRSFLEAHRSLIEQVWKQSEQSSLRILRHVVADIRRLHGLIDPRHKANSEAIDHLLRFFVALDIEVRSGNVDEHLIVDRYQKYIDEFDGGTDKEMPRPITDLVLRYSGSDITGSMLSDRLLVEMLIKGRYNKGDLASWLDQTAYFAAPNEVRPWQIVISFDQIDDQVLSEGITQMNAQFDNRSITEMGEFFHVAALRLMMAENGILPHDKGEEEKLCHAYIDDLSSSGQLPPRLLDYDPTDRISQGFAGHMYWGVEQSPELRRIIEHWQDAASAALDQKLPEYGAKIIELMRDNPKDLFKTISRTNYHYSPLSDTPIMHHIDPAEFVEAWLSGQRSSWRETSLALDNRYAFGALDKDLALEKGWLAKVASEFDKRTRSAQGLAKLRLQRLRPKSFDYTQ